jgi:hypothetical protein
MKEFLKKDGKTLKGLNKIYSPLLGFVAFLWFLIRVIPKPSRAVYPCQRLAFPIASGFIIWISVNILSFAGIKKLVNYYKRKNKLIAFFSCIILTVFYLIWLSLYPANYNYASIVNQNPEEIFIPTDSVNSPIGIGRGIFPGRVVWAFDTTSVKWDGISGHWWDDKNTDQAEVTDMIARSLHKISGEENDSAAWDAIFKYFNNLHGKGNVGYKAGEKIAVKLSLVQCTTPGSDGSNNNFTPPQTVLALLRQLVYNAGVDADNITFYDIMRNVPISIVIRCKNEFPKVHFVGARADTYQEKYTRDTTIIRWSEELKMEINGGNTAYLPTIITKANYIINLANLKGHRYVGVTGCSKNHFGSMSADGDVNTPHAIGLHSYVTVHDFIIPGSAEWSFSGRPMGSYNALVDLMGHEDLGEKTLLFIIDGLYSVATESVQNSEALNWQQAPFNNHFSSSIFMSQDNVAIESVAVDFWRTEQAVNPDLTQVFYDGTGVHNVIFGNIDNYLHEAAQADNPPSGTKYAPNGDRIGIPSLGVHEHWNNATDKQYSRNLGKNTGIELNKISPTLNAPSGLSVSTSITGSILLSWTNEGITDGKVIVYKSTGSTVNYKPIAILPGDIISFEDTSAYNITTYYYRLKRATDSTYSPFSNEAKATITNINNEFINYSFNIYPNPAHQIINLNFSNPLMGIVSIRIIDMSGRIIRSLQFQKSYYIFQQSIRIDDLSKDLYIIELSIRNNNYSKLFQVE